MSILRFEFQCAHFAAHTSPSCVFNIQCASTLRLGSPYARHAKIHLQLISDHPFLKFQCAPTLRFDSPYARHANIHLLLSYDHPVFNSNALALLLICPSCVLFQCAHFAAHMSILRFQFQRAHFAAQFWETMTSHLDSAHSSHFAI